MVLLCFSCELGVRYVSEASSSTSEITDYFWAFPTKFWDSEPSFERHFLLSHRCLITCFSTGLSVSHAGCSLYWSLWCIGACWSWWVLELKPSSLMKDACSDSRCSKRSVQIVITWGLRVCTGFVIFFQSQARACHLTPHSLCFLYYLWRKS